MPGPHLVVLTAQAVDSPAPCITAFSLGTPALLPRRVHLPVQPPQLTKHAGMLFYRLLQQAVDTDPHPLKDLIGG